MLSDEEFSRFIGKFLFSPNGAKYNKNFRFDGQFKCDKPAPPITVSKMMYFFVLIS